MFELINNCPRLASKRTTESTGVYEVLIFTCC
nr:MAG TPA: Neurohypophysial hormone [Caudoviricetes sp.]